MTPPTFGLFALMQQRHAERGNVTVFRDLDDQVALCEDMGFETVWFGEHHFSGYSLCPSPLLAAGYFALGIRSMPTFYAGLALLCFGNGLLKPNISAMVGNLYAPDDPRRDAVT